jgi:hypothetical protein
LGSVGQAHQLQSGFLADIERYSDVALVGKYLPHCAKPEVRIKTLKELEI